MKSSINDPKTVILHHHLGIGDFVQHLPYIRAVAEKSRDGKVSVIARPSTLADQILTTEECVEHIILYDRKPRSKEKRRGSHKGLFGMIRFAKELKTYGFDRILILSDRINYQLLALTAGIPQRGAYGFKWHKRLMLNLPPYIQKYRGEQNPVYSELTDYMVKHGYTEGPIVPKIKVPAGHIKKGAEYLADLPERRIAVAIGSSEMHKNLGAERFSILAASLLQKGFGVVMLGGPVETQFAEGITSMVPEELRSGLITFCQTDILLTAGILKNCTFCTGNDTGVLNLALACDLPSIGYFGGRTRLHHDPLILGMSAETMESITVDMILNEMHKNQWF